MSEATKAATGASKMSTQTSTSVVSLLLSVVAPISVKAVDKSAARTELLTTRNWIKSIAFQSFVESRSYQLELKDDMLYLYQTDTNQLIKTKKLESLRFDALQVNFNNNGLVSPTQLQGYFRDEPLMISLESSSK